MTESEVQAVEGAIGRSLPVGYRSLLIQYPTALCAQTRVDYEDEAGRPVMFSVADRELANTPEAVVAMNRDDPSNYQWSMRLENWPENFLIIGCNDSGGVYSIDLSVSDGPVYFADQSTSFAFNPESDGLDGYFEKVADSVSDWANRLMAQHGG